MERLTNAANTTTSIAYGTAGVSTLHSLLNYFSPHEWQALGVIGGLSIAFVTALVNAYFRSKESKYKRKKYEHNQ